jgi:fumarylpyruvate hydrolase
MTAADPELLFPAKATPTVPITGEQRRYPIHRIFCVGRNYAEHAKEMGHEVDRDAPWYFMKPATATVLSDQTIPYPSETRDYQYEMELVVAVGRPAFRVVPEKALEYVYGFACGLDMTRRDLQLEARKKSRPWDLGKSFEQSAVIGTITPTSKFGAITGQRIWLRVGEVIRQDSNLSELVWSVPELVSHLSRFYHLGPGDLIYTGTPAGVGPVLPGESIIGEIEGLSPVKLSVAGGQES